jgi:DNA polymerase-3 subunit alpha
MMYGLLKNVYEFLSRVGTFGSADLSTSSSSLVSPKNLNRKSLESLIKCGALDSFEKRGTLLENIETLLAFHRESTAVAPQDSLFSSFSAAPSLKLASGKPISLTDKLAWEKELLGIYVSGHPLDAHNGMTARAKISIAKMKEDKQPGIPFILPALVISARTFLTKSGEKMAFLKLEDKTDSIEAVAFPKLFKQHAAVLVPGACVLAKGKVSLRNGEVSLAIDELKPL